MAVGARATSQAVLPARWPVIHGQGGFIVELTGPAAAGKTTLARALEGALGARGVPARLVASLRPGERGSGHDRASSALMAPLSRATKLFGALGTLLPRDPAESLVRELMEALPPRGWIRSLRVRRYLRNLCRSWNAAQTAPYVSIFDQGFMNSLCSLALFSGLLDRNSLERGLSLVPVPDLLIRIDTPREILRVRLERRLGRQTRIERLFERDIESALRQFELSSCLDDLLADRGGPSLQVSWREEEGLATAVQAIADEIMLRRKAARHDQAPREIDFARPRCIERTATAASFSRDRPRTA